MNALYAWKHTERNTQTQTQIVFTFLTFPAWKHTERNRQRDRKKYVMTSGGFMIPVVQNNSLNDST